jgi:hypothetical protein
MNDGRKEAVDNGQVQPEKSDTPIVTLSRNQQK